MDIINKRRSIRRYSEEEVSDELLLKLLEAAMQAPSAVNQQAWHFVYTRNNTVINELKNSSRGSKNIENAKLVIIPCIDKNKIKMEEFVSLDLAASTQNILLEATFNNIGSLWVGIYPKEDRVNNVKSILNLDDNLIPFSLVGVGYPLNKEDIKYINRFDKDLITKI